MFTKAVAQQSARLAALRTGNASLSRFVSPAAVAVGMRGLQQRSASTAPPIPADSAAAQKIVVDQRLQRPVSPHLTIYKLQTTMVMSGLHRVTGIVLAGPIYLFGIAYVLAPAMGWHLEMTSLAAAFGAWPVAAKVLVKSVAALPFTFHSLNGIRHLVWDFGYSFKNKQVINTGMTVAVLAVLSAVGLAVW